MAEKKESPPNNKKACRCCGKVKELGGNGCLANLCEDCWRAKVFPGCQEIKSVEYIDNMAKGLMKQSFEILHMANVGIIKAMVRHNSSLEEWELLISRLERERDALRESKRKGCHQTTLDYCISLANEILIYRQRAPNDY